MLVRRVSCKGVKPGGGNIAECLKEHEKDLLEGCKACTAGLREKGREFAQNCRGDVAKLRRGVQPGGGRMIECLKDHESELYEPCRTYFKQSR